ncbi:MAG: TldD/PmbA family protein, partial [Fibrobacterales bacterium]
MDKKLAETVIQAGIDSGADFVELFVEETRNSSLLYKDQKVENASAGTEFGVGIRLLFGTEVLYAHTSVETEDSMVKLVRELAAARNGSSANGIVPVRFQDMSFKDIHPVIKDPRKVGQEHKLPFLKRADEVARATSNQITQVAVTAYDTLTQIEIYNSEGLAASDKRSRARFTVNVTAGEGGERFSAHESPGALQGFEYFENLDVDSYTTAAAERAVLMLDAGYVQGGHKAVVMGNGFGGVIFHEACGHPLETESIRRKASPFCDKLGEQIAHTSVTAIDDGTVPNMWGSLNIDDEGMTTGKTTLIEKGILKSYMSDRVGAEEVGVPRTGSARRESYKYAPVSRMRNSYIAPGSDSLEEMLASSEGGIYAKKMGGGSVNPATGEFNFAVEEGYLIKNGKIGEPLRGATLIGKGHEILTKISMVGNDLEHAAGMCGASSGSVPVTVGQPTLKVDSILV